MINFPQLPLEPVGAGEACLISLGIPQPGQKYREYTGAHCPSAVQSAGISLFHQLQKFIAAGAVKLALRIHARRSLQFG
jgi:hypothetical protein